MTYELYYWPFIPGRGEFVRLVLVEAGVEWIDVGKLPKDQGGGIGVIVKARVGALGGMRPYAPPILKADELVLAQTANICHFLACRHGLVGDDEGSRALALQTAMTLADVVSEVHDTHHPLGSGKYYEDQRNEAMVASLGFRTDRMPKLLGYFESIAGEWLLGDAFSYVDLTLFQTLAGLQFAFPRACRRQLANYPKLTAIRDRVAARPRIAAWVAERDPFNNDGIFRYYPELDG